MRKVDGLSHRVLWIRSTWRGVLERFMAKAETVETLPSFKLHAESPIDDVSLFDPIAIRAWLLFPSDPRSALVHRTAIAGLADRSPNLESLAGPPLFDLWACIIRDCLQDW